MIEVSLVLNDDELHAVCYAIEVATAGRRINRHFDPMLARVLARADALMGRVARAEGW